MKSLILVVDDQPEICEFTRKCLEGAGYAVRTFSGAKSDSEKEIKPPSLIIIGMSLHDGSGPAFPCDFFDTSHSDRIPRIVLFDGSSEEQRLIALKSGADDCIAKPFSSHELVARVQAVLRRSVLSNRVGHSHTADIVIDSWAMRLSVRGIEIPTTALEFRLLEYLARHRGQVFTRDFLLDAVWGDMRFINPRSVDACIRRIREKIEQDRAKPVMLKTIRGVGYRLDAVAAWESAPNAVCDCPACRTKDIDLRWNISGSRQRRSSAAS